MRASVEKLSSRNMLSITTLLAIFATLAVNILSNVFPAQGLTIGEIANTFLKDVQIIPANYAFAIWGLIYLGLIAYGIYQLRLPQHSDSSIRRVNALLIIACIAQIAWVYLFTLRLFWPSVVAMLGILLLLIRIYLQLRINGERALREQYWLVHVPFSVYLGWISVATIVNIASALYVSGWNGWGIRAESWTVMMLIVGAVIAAIVAIQRGDTPFTLVFVWAYVAIANRQLNNLSIAITAVVAAVMLIALLWLSRMRRKTFKSKPVR